MSEHFQTSEAVSLPDSAQGCRKRMAELMDEIASIRIQIATSDIRRQTEKRTLDAAWFHRAKTALRLKRHELTQVTGQLASFAHQSHQPHCAPREAFKDALIEVVRAESDDEKWSGLLHRARALHDSKGASHG